jgi:hypothetical protein
MLLYFSQIMIVHDNTKRLPDMLPISNNQQWPAGNSGHPGLCGCHVSSTLFSRGHRLLSTIKLVLALELNAHLSILCHSFISTTSIFQFSTIVKKLLLTIYTI